MTRDRSQESRKLQRDVMMMKTTQAKALMLVRQVRHRVCEEIPLDWVSFCHTDTVKMRTNMT